MPERLTEVTVNGRTLTAGMEVSLPKSAGRRAGRYRFDWAEIDNHDRLILNVYGPLRSRGGTPHYRLAAATIVKTVHTGTRG